MPKIIKNGRDYSGVPIEVVTAWLPTEDSVQIKEPIIGNTDISDIGDGTITGAIDSLNEAIHTKEYTLYGFKLFGGESSPNANVIYLEDASGMTPAHMDFTNGVFDYGSWENAFFMPKPCMVKFDGTVDYYLDPNDFDKKADGTASDFKNVSYAGNAMIEFGQNGKKIWYKIIPDAANGAEFYISDTKIDPAYKCWSFINSRGEEISHFYMPACNGYLDSNNKMRSIGGQAIKQSLAGASEQTYCLNNNTTSEVEWYTDVFCDRILINMLLVLIGKSTDTQTVFGQGLTSGNQTALNDYRTGALSDKGMFFGYSDTTHGVKVFGIENWWGAQWRRTAGLNLNNGTLKYKMTQPYSEASTDYTSVGAGIGGTSGGYISQMRFTEDAFMAKTVSGSSSTYYCDGQWFNNSGNMWSLFGGTSHHGALCGCFCCDLSGALSYSGWNSGCALSLKPLS